MLDSDYKAQIFSELQKRWPFHYDILTPVELLHQSGFQMENTHTAFHLSWYSQEENVGRTPGPLDVGIYYKALVLLKDIQSMFLFMPREPLSLPLRAGIFISLSLCSPYLLPKDEPMAQFETQSILMPWRELQGLYIKNDEGHGGREMALAGTCFSTSIRRKGGKSSKDFALFIKA